VAAAVLQLCDASNTPQRVHITLHYTTTRITSDQNYIDAQNLIMTVYKTLVHTAHVDLRSPNKMGLHHSQELARHPMIQSYDRMDPQVL
jgi:hypothetical protein